MSVDLTIRLCIGGDHPPEGGVQVTCEFLVEPKARDNPRIGISPVNADQGRPMRGPKREDEAVINDIGVTDSLNERDWSSRSLAHDYRLGFLSGGADLSVLGQGYQLSSSGIDKATPYDPAAR